MEKRPPLPYQILKQIFASKSKGEPKYEDLLLTEEWLTFRNLIKERDNETCTSCNINQFRKKTAEEFSEELSTYGKYFNLLSGEYEDTPNGFTLKQNANYPSELIFDNTVKLEVHHKYYIWKKLPWEYDMNVLTTLCNNCHEKEHFDSKRIVYTDDNLSQVKVLIICRQ